LKSREFDDILYVNQLPLFVKEGAVCKYLLRLSFPRKRESRNLEIYKRELPGFPLSRE
jgi:hypothetical protein